jgi:hypothetical protein
MYHDLKVTYWWYGMKRNIAKYIALCDTVRDSQPSIIDPLGCCSLAITRVKVGRDCYGFCVGIA